MNVERISYDEVGDHRLFYLTDNFDAGLVVTANCYTAGSGKKFVNWRKREDGIWDISFHFELPGKYCFSIHENSNRTLVLIVTINK